jgi:hypothetical protein
MIIGMLGLIVLALFGNILYYEYMYRKPVEKDQDVMKGYLELYRRKYGSGRI